MKGLVFGILTLGIYFFWYSAEISRFRVRNTIIDGAHGELTLTGGEFFRLYLVQVLGLTLSLGLAFPWLMSYALRFTLERMRFVGSIDFATIEQSEFQGSAAADGFADALDVGLAI